jgi:hypothetical protein
MHPPEGKAQGVDFGEAEKVDEVDRVSRHRRDIVGRLTDRAADPGLSKAAWVAMSSSAMSSSGCLI